MHEIKLDRSSSNALSKEFMLRLTEQIHDAGQQPLLISSTGDAFSVGADLKQILAFTAEEIIDYVKVMERFLTTLLNHPAPTVAAVNGHATGGGCLIFLCCDFAYCKSSQDILIGLPEVGAGVLVSPTLMAMFKQLLPFPILRKLLLSAKLISPQKSLEYGLFDAIGDDFSELAEQQLLYLNDLPKPIYGITKTSLLKPASSQDEFEQNIQQLVASGALSAKLSGKFK